MTIEVQSLWNQEHYLAEREQLRQEIMQEKKLRRIAIGDNLTLLFENRRTIFYQVMEMLRLENKWSDADKEEELSAYIPLITTAGNLKATMLIEFPDEHERRYQLKRLHGIEDQVFCQVGDHPRVFAVADEDMERSTESKTSAVHFLRFPLTTAMSNDLNSGASLGFGCDHPYYHQDNLQLPTEVRNCLVTDLEEAA